MNVPFLPSAAFLISDSHSSIWEVSVQVEVGSLPPFIFFPLFFVMV